MDKSKGKWDNLKWVYKLPIILAVTSLITTQVFLNCYEGGCSENVFLSLLYVVSPSIVVWGFFDSNIYLSHSFEMLIVYSTNVIFFAIIGLIFGWLVDINKK